MSGVALAGAQAAPAAAALKSLVTVRERCANVAAAVGAGASTHFTIRRERLDAAAERVAAITRERYPDLDVPGHSRWRHFEAGGVDRIKVLDRALQGAGVADAARAQIDLAVVSVLLDAGAGPRWRYVEADTGLAFSRSEGLAIATLRAFLAGVFSARRGEPCRVDAEALIALDVERVARVFQASPGNPLVGLEGRVALLQRLGHALANPALFGYAARPGVLFDVLTREGEQEAVRAADIVAELLDRLGPVWLANRTLDGVLLGDTWPHPHAGGKGPTAGLVPFHKLTQWLAYSLFEPFQSAGVPVLEPDALTALPEYRNGGLLIDTGVLALRDPAAMTRAHPVGSELVVEWRALTVALIDELAPRVRAVLGLPRLPLAAILEGGTWAAGRRLAEALRAGAPPLAIESDGTVF
ncbi:MAG TPA: URC4/urg3 family protein [Casimicrobiaceae bacterium]